MKQEFIEDLGAGVDTDSLYAIRLKGSLTKYKGKPGMWFSLIVGDKTGEMPLKYWGKTLDKTKKLYDSLKTGDVIHILGTVKEYQGQLEINVDESIQELTKQKEYVIEDFLPHTEKDPKHLEKRLDELISSVKNPDLKKLLDSFFTDKEFHCGCRSPRDIAQGSGQSRSRS